ncbi:MAG: integrase arm-type DNA-binding domain-containing protein [Pseudomonadota bacterium]
MLTDTQIRNARKADKPYKMTDGSGLHLFVTPAGGKLWRYRYEVGEKERLLSLGAYPGLSLLEARKARDAARELLKSGRDPSAQRKLEKHSAKVDTFEEISREWFELNKTQWVERHANDVIESLEKEVFPALGARPMRTISAIDVLAVLRPIEARGAKETARRIRQRISGVFVYAIASGRCDNDPAAVVKGAMAPIKKGRQPAVTNLIAARAMLQRVDDETAHPVTKLALRILALTAVRPGTLATTPWHEWTNLDPYSPVWTIPAERMKLRLQHKDDEARDHLVPLSRQAVEAIEALRTISGRGPLAFPNARHAHKAMSENAMGYLLNRAGYHGRHVPHGWRSTFSTVMNELYRADRQVIDLMLAHVPKDDTEAAYNRARHMERRRELAQLWADMILDGARPAADLLTGPRR